jgi:uncharacterized RDD family membrane protein YckC
MSDFEKNPRRAAAMATSGIEREFAERAALQRKSDAWRNEVVNKIAGYKVKRSKKTLAGEYSMKFDFEPRVEPRIAPRGSAMPVEYYPPAPEPGPPPQPRVTVSAPPLPQAASPAPAASRTPAANRANRAPAARPAPPPYAEPASQGPDPSLWPAWVQPKIVASSSPAEPKVIEFPRSLLFPEMDQPPASDPFELAESILERPRILDVPETVSVPAPPLAGLALEAAGDEDEQDVSADDELKLELPLQVAGLVRRVAAAIVDGLVLAVYLAVFALIVKHGIHGLAPNKTMLAVGLAVPVVLWSAYQYLFLVYAAQTPGMRLAGLQISSFEGQAARAGRRRGRALMLVLSFVSLGFGFWWALVDEYSLCWHDRLTRTYLTTAR